MTDFCVLYKLVLCILYDLSIVFPLFLCYIIARKGDTNVQVKTLECKINSTPKMITFDHRKCSHM